MNNGRGVLLALAWCARQRSHTKETHASSLALTDSMVGILLLFITDRFRTMPETQ